MNEKPSASYVAPEPSAQQALANAIRGNASGVESPKADLSILTSVEQPWMRLDGEPGLWYDRFVRYYLPLGPSRTLIQAVRDYALDRGENPKNLSSLWYAESGPWLWDVRAEAYDDYMRQEDLLLWEKRQRELREWEWRISLASLQLVSGALEEAGVFMDPPVPPALIPVGASRNGRTVPSSVRLEEFDAQAPGFERLDLDPEAESESEDPNEGKVKVKLSREMRPAELARILEAASKVARLSSGMATTHNEHVHRTAPNMDKVRQERWESAAPALRDALIEDGEYEELTAPAPRPLLATTGVAPGTEEREEEVWENEDEDGEEYFTLNAAAKIVGVHHTSLRKSLQYGHIPGAKKIKGKGHRGMYHIPKSALMKYMARLELRERKNAPLPELPPDHPLYDA